jgi:hypothetical protein
LVTLGVLTFAGVLLRFVERMSLRTEVIAEIETSRADKKDQGTEESRVGALVLGFLEGLAALQGPLTYERGRVVAVPYDVPMKAINGAPQTSVRTLAVTPFGWCDSIAECDEVENALMASFAGGHGVASKQTHTKAFLDEARKHWRPPQR